jgi:hypothetical protein
MLWKIDPQTFAIVDSLVVGYEPNSIVADKDGKLWILCDGGVDPDILNDSLPVLVEVDPDLMIAERVFTFPSREMSPTDLEINPQGDTLYFLNTSWSFDSPVFGLYRMSIYGDLPAEAFIKQQERRFYALKIDEQTNKIYLSDAKDFLVAGSVLEYSSAGKLLKEYPSGVIPGDFLFLR